MTTSTTDRPLRASRDDLAAVVVDRLGERAVVETTVQPGYDVFTIPHGGYLLALVGAAALAASGEPDLFTITTHFLRKAQEGPLRFEVETVGGSRRFTSLHLRATQDGATVLSGLATVGDREGITGPGWERDAAWVPDPDALVPPAGTPGLDLGAFTPPNVAERYALQPERAGFAFARGVVTGDATLRAQVNVEEPTQLDALVASDITPPAVWNALGAKGWVPTLELTAHVRARPARGPMTVVASTAHVTDGFLDEDAIVRDSAGTLVVQSRQLARWTGA